ncbi:iron-sulfur cluster repair di-iron protein [Clostridium sp. MSJ-11]|uniref:Iron-sulfur cluster repair di-iron protein n=1 Tax=Clostridium mobile TaxID=2841512 RepID=A0ABS6EGI6_9CLOT|nr:iron-sulfur cluster repair di-iron protein [Clostridium mobile]MBU5483595.1 iron-sulfur cluster repair di-iron protein [Clostridium mobile]
MNKVFKSSHKIGDIVVKFPKAMDVFRRHGIDFCCGGNRPLIDAIKEDNLNEEEVLKDLLDEYEKIDSLIKEEVDWLNISYNDLIDYIVNKHHGFLNEELPIVSELTTKILRVHGENHPELSKVYKLFHNLKMELEEHLIKEEEIVFPLIKKYEKEGSKEALDNAIKIIEELEAEHTGAGDILKELRKITHNYEVPKDGCNTYKYTYDKLQEIELDLFNHIHLENNIMFPRLKK